MDKLVQLMQKSHVDKFKIVFKIEIELLEVVKMLRVVRVILMKKSMGF